MEEYVNYNRYISFNQVLPHSVQRGNKFFEATIDAFIFVCH
jgi:hypothetical protein